MVTDLTSTWTSQQKQLNTLTGKLFQNGAAAALSKALDTNNSLQKCYLGRTKASADEAFVWRRADCGDAPCADSIGPFAYNKAKGKPVRVWGLLADGQLHNRVLERAEVMDKSLHVEIIELQKVDGLLRILSVGLREVPSLQRAS